LKIQRTSPKTLKRIEFWKASAAATPQGYDTVGCVVKGFQGELFAGTSTGGRGFEMPGRISDCCTVAGNYATKFAAISLTGIGEEIVDDAVAARIETRCRDGMTLKDACEKTFSEATAKERSYGWIALTSKGEWGACYTTETMAFLVMGLDGKVLASS
jgi:L-asparaginase